MKHEQSAGDFHFTSESVTEGHPDKMADQISDAVLDAILSEDPYGRVACETFVTTGLALIGGEILVRDPRILLQLEHDLAVDSVQGDRSPRRTNDVRLRCHPDESILLFGFAFLPLQECSVRLPTKEIHA